MRPFSIPGLPGGDDWLFFHYTVQRIISSEPLYLINAGNTNPSNVAKFLPTMGVPDFNNTRPTSTKHWKRYYFNNKYSNYDFNSPQIQS